MKYPSRACASFRLIVSLAITFTLGASFSRLQSLSFTVRNQSIVDSLFPSVPRNVQAEHLGYYQSISVFLPLFSTFSLGLRIQVLPLRRGWLIDSQFVRDVSILPITFSKPTWSHDGAIRSPEPPFSDLRLDHIHKILPDGRIASVAYLHWIASSKAAQQDLELQIDNRTRAVLTKMHPFIAMCFTLVVTTHSWVLIPITISCVSLSSWQHFHEYRTHYYSFSYPI